MSRHRICVIPGDGIGREVVPVAVRVLESLGLDLEIHWYEAGLSCLETRGDTLPEDTLEACRNAEATLFGAITTPPGSQDFKSAIQVLRKRLDLYANVRPVASIPLPGFRSNVDLVVVRENTEGLYSGIEEGDGERATALRVITRRGSERIARFAFDYARRTGRTKVTIVHKANVLRKTCGLFRAVALEVAEEFPEIETNEMIVDAMAMRLMRDPENFQVIVTTNLFGDILSDEASMLGGGLGLAASGNIGDSAAIFEPVHGSAPDIAGQGIANPIAAVLSAAMMLDHLGELEAAGRVQAAVRSVLGRGVFTPDLGGSATTTQVADAICSSL